MRRVSIAATLLCLLGFAWATVFPFDVAPQNRVVWDADSGLRFQSGMIYGGPAVPDGSDRSVPCSIEFWVRSSVSLTGRGVIAMFFDENISRLIGIEQSGGDVLWIHRRDPSSTYLLGSRHALTGQPPTLITVASTASRTVAVYFNAVRARSTRRGQTEVSPWITAADCDMAFVLGNGATSAATWQGDLLGLAIYDRALSQEEVERHYDAWRVERNTGTPEIESALRARVLYLFEEGVGDTARDATGGGRDLRIPSAFRLPVQPILGSPGWAEIRMYYTDWRDIILNVAAFAPFGFFVAASLALRNPWLAVAVGGGSGVAVSLAIETLQSFLPMRTSSLADLGCNAVGATLGGLIWLVWSRRSQGIRSAA